MAGKAGLRIAYSNQKVLKKEKLNFHLPSWSLERE
jgi:hypothetical protein